VKGIVVDVLEEFAAAIAKGPVPDALCDRVVRERPGADVLIPRMESILPKSTLAGRCAIVTVAIELADDPRYRPFVEALIDVPDDVSAHFAITLYSSGVRLDGEALGWWFDTMANRPGLHDLADLLIQKQPGRILAVRRDAVIAHLADPGRGPGNLGVWAAEEVLCALGRVPAIEQAWLRWIRDRRATGSGLGELAKAVRPCLEAGVLTEGDELVREARSSP
jgi:hypothetical protein